MLSAPAIRRLLAERAIVPTSALGQNFVADANTLRRVVRLAATAPGDPVLELGAGLGSLTLALAEAGAKVVAVETDARLLEVLTEAVRGQPVAICHADALALDWDGVEEAGASLGVPRGSSPWSLVANLPYNLATPLVLRVLEAFEAVATMVVMVQREVGERLAARPKSPAYGAVSVKVAYAARAEVVGRVPPQVFVPRPKVSSVLVRLTRLPAPAVDPAVVGRERLFAVVEAGFAQRRKMLRRSLREVVAPEAFADAGVAPEARAEELSVEAWGRLAAGGQGTSR